MWGDLDDKRPKVGRRELPHLEELLPDERPGFYRLGRRRNRQMFIAKVGKQRPNGFSQAEAEPRHRTQHYKKSEESDYNRRQCTVAKNFCREPIEDRIERHSEDDAPGNDCQKRTDEDKRPVSKKSKADQSNCENDEFFVRCSELYWSIIVVHCCDTFVLKSRTGGSWRAFRAMTRAGTSALRRRAPSRSDRNLTQNAIPPARVERRHPMRTTIFGAIAVVSLALVDPVPARAAPANASAVCKAANELNPVIQARCWCSYRALTGRCYRWRCR